LTAAPGRGYQARGRAYFARPRAWINVIQAAPKPTKKGPWGAFYARSRFGLG